MKEKPTVSDIKTLRDKCRLYYAEMQTRIEKCLDYYEGNFTVKAPRGFEAYKPPTGRSLVDNAVDNHVTSNPIVTVPRQKDTEKWQLIADKLEKFYQAFLYQNAVNNPIPPIREAAKQSIATGMFCFKGPLFIENQGKGFNRRFPLYFTAVNPASILAEPSFFWNGQGACMEIKKKTVNEIKSLWPKWKTGLDDYMELDCLEYCDDNWRAYMVGDEFVFGPVPNIYGYNIYELGFSGLGRITGKPEELAVGLLWPVLSALDIEARAKTARDAIVQVHAFPRLMSDLDPAMLNIGMAPGDISHVPTSYNLRPMTEVRVPAGLDSHIPMIMEDIRQGTYSEVVEGDRPTGYDSGYMLAISVGRARLKFGQSLNSLENKLSRVLAKASYLLENVLTEPVDIWGNIGGKSFADKISPEEVNGHYTSYVSLANTTPEEDDRRSVLGLKLYQAGTISLLRYLEHYARVQDASGEIKRILVEGVLKQDAVLAAIASAAVQSWGMDEYIKQEQTAPQPGVPGNGEMPAGMMPGQTGAPSQQELIMRQMQRLGPPGQGGPLGSPQERPF